MFKKIKIGADIDDCLADFWNAYCKYFNTKQNPKMLEDRIITKNVQQILSKDKNFWLGLEVLNNLNFIPELYCTKRVNNKRWTKAWLEKNDFPDSAVYQVSYLGKNKADVIRGRCDVLIDDSPYNVYCSWKVGFPALLFDTPRNKDFGPVGRIYSLDYDEIEEAYYLLLATILRK